MERYTIFLDWKNQHCENDYTTQSNLHIQCNPYQSTTGIFHRTRMKNITNKMRTLVDGLNNKFDTFEELGDRSEEVTQTQREKEIKTLKQLEDVVTGMRRPIVHLITNSERTIRKNQGTAIFRETMDENVLTFPSHNEFQSE